MSGPRFYCQPPAPIIHLYERRDDGCWYAGPDALLAENPEMVHWEEGQSQMPVGDVNSDKKGTGARALGEDKVHTEYIPVRLWVDSLRGAGPRGGLMSSLAKLADFQEGDDCAVQYAINELPWAAMDEACAVFHYGAERYAAWNWLKGMPWSVVTGCALRHALAITRGEEMDPESGLPHRGHYVCNLIMLAQYVSSYRSGDDRPPKEYFNE